jgi:uncharacterized protein
MVDFAASDIRLEDQVLERIVSCVRGAVEPELILLFGSRARGEAHEGSDYDLMIVLPNDVTDVESTGREIHHRLSESRISADVFTRTAAQYERRQRDPGLFDFAVAREGTILYDTGRVPQRFIRATHVREEPPREGLDLWIRRGKSDLKGAEQLLAAAEPTWDSISFHSHACAEKLLKALVVQAGSFPPRTHKLTDLLDLQEPSIRDDATLRADCDLLTRLLPLSRYPECPEPTPDEGREAIAAARRIAAILMPRLEVTR